MKKLQCFVPHFIKLNSSNVLIYYTKWNILSLHLSSLWWLRLTDNENPTFLRKLNCYQTSTEILLKSTIVSMHSVFDWGSFCINYCINATWHGGDQPVVLLRLTETQVAMAAAEMSPALLGLVSLSRCRAPSFALLDFFLPLSFQ